MPSHHRILASLVAAGLAASLCAQTWRPAPTQIPAPYVQWVTKLLETGAMEDLRRGRARRVVVMLGAATNHPSMQFQTVGWVMPGDRRAILLDGLSYPVVRVVGPADLDRARRDEALLGFALGELACDPQATLPALFLLAGETRRAEREFGRSPDNHLTILCRRLWSRLVTRWTMQLGQAWIDRDDLRALRAAEGLVAAWHARESRPELFTSEPDGPVDSALANQILADCQRRVVRPVPPFDLGSIEGLPADERIARLMLGLEDVRARVDGINSGGTTGSDPIVFALAAEGRAAEPALRRAVESDERMTRAMLWPRGPYGMRTPVTVRMVAQQALDRIEVLERRK